MSPPMNFEPLRTTGGLETVGMRCPDHAVTRAIIEASGVPVAAPSANTSGRPSCTTAEHVREDMWGKIDGIVDGGPCQVGVESTIIDLTVTPPQMLRPGGLPLESLRDALFILHRAEGKPFCLQCSLFFLKPRCSRAAFRPAPAS